MTADDSRLRPVTKADVLNAMKGVKQLGAVRMSAVAAYRVARLRTDLGPSVEAIEAGRQALVVEYGATAAHAVPDDRIAEFAAAWAVYVATPVEELAVVPLSVGGLVTSDNKAADVTPDMLTLLGPWVVD